MATSDNYTRLIGEVANLKRQLAGTFRQGTVKEVKGDQMRMVIGKDSEGGEVLSPWTNTSDRRGGARTRSFFKEKQNLMLLCPNGDVSQAVVLPYAPNKDHQAPDHANESGQDEEVFQLDSLRVKKTKDGYNIWLQDPEKKDQQQGSGEKNPAALGGGSKTDEQPPKDRKPQKAEAKVSIQLKADGGVTARIGENTFAVDKKGVKMEAGGDHATVQKGELRCSRPWRIEKTDVKHLKDEDI